MIIGLICTYEKDLKNDYEESGVRLHTHKFQL